MKNLKGGKNHKKRGKPRPTPKYNITTDELTFYATVLKILGNGHADIKTHDNRNMRVIIPGKFHKKVWFKPGDVVQTNGFEILRLAEDTNTVTTTMNKGNVFYDKHASDDELEFDSDEEGRSDGDDTDDNNDDNRGDTNDKVDKGDTIDSDESDSDIDIDNI